MVSHIKDITGIKFGSLTAINIAEATNRTNYGKRPNIKLSQEEVDEILHLYFSGEVTNQSELARMYGVTPSAICRLIPLELNKRNKPI